MEKTYQHVVPQEANSVRIDKYLSELYKELSRSKISNLIKNGGILVNNGVVKTSYKVVVDDAITINIPEEKSMTTEPENIPLNIAYEDEHLIIINKPPGMVVHPAVGHPTGTLVNALTYHFKSLSTLQGNLRPGIVHRLDMDTSGLLMVAKNDFTHAELTKQLSVHSITRAYNAITWGNLPDEKFVIDAPIGRSPKNRQKMAVVEGGRYAKTHVETIEHFAYCNFVQCRLETGRTHQIRVHLSHNGHPVFGDAIYGGRKKYLKQIPDWYRHQAKEILAITQRQMLHAYLLGFVHPHTEKYIEFCAPIPDDMEKVLSALRNLV